MSIDEIQSFALGIPGDQRAKLAGQPLASLPAMLVDEDEGIAEANRRAEERKEERKARPPRWQLRGVSVSL